MDTIKISTYPNVKQAIWLLLLYLFLLLGLLILVKMIESITNIDFGSNQFILGGIELSVFCLILRFGLKKTKTHRYQVIPFIPINLLLFFPITMTILGIIIFPSKIINIANYLLPRPKFLEEFLYVSIGANESFWETFFYFALASSLIEELLCRGLILHGFLLNYSKKKAILFSAILFACMHFNPWSFFRTFLIGLLLAWWVIRTGSLWPSLFGHVFHNGMVVFIYYFNIYGFINNLQFWWLIVFGLLLTVFGLWWFHQMTKREEADQLEVGVEPEGHLGCDGHINA